MNWRPTTRRRALTAALAVLFASGVGLVLASDHQDTPFTELNPKSDLTDVYAFPGATTGRIVLVMDTLAFLTPAEAQDPAQASFDDNLLYQFKIDNDGDAKEDKVIQIGFTGENTSQRVEVRGPMAPPAASRSSPGRMTIRSSSISRRPSARSPTDTDYHAARTQGSDSHAARHPRARAAPRGTRRDPRRGDPHRRMPLRYR